MRFSCFLRGTRSCWVQPSGDGRCLPQAPWVTLSRSSVMKHQSPRPKLPTLPRCLVRIFGKQSKGLRLRCLVILGGLYMSQYVLFFQWFYWLEGTLLYKNHPWSEIEVVRIYIFVESGRGIRWMFCCYPERNVTFLEDLKGIVADSTTERNSSNLIYQGKKLHWCRFTCGKFLGDLPFFSRKSAQIGTSIWELQLIQELISRIN